MILTCPDCATRYFVRDGSIPDGGRKVRCTSCGNLWHARGDDLVADDEPVTEPHGFGFAGDGGSSPAASPPREAAATISPDVGPDFAPGVGAASAYAEFSASPPLSAEIRARVRAQRETRDAVTAGVVWAVLCAAFALVLVGAVLFKVQVVRLFPATAGAYAAIKMPVNPLGLSLENVQGGPGLSNGRPTLVVSGVERNIEIDARFPAPVRVALFDRAGKPLREQVARVEGPPLAPGETRPFSVSIYDPPISVAEYQVEFVLETPRVNKVSTGRRGAASHPPMPLRGATQPVPGVAHGSGEPDTHMPEEARPLPPGSPYALPSEGKLRPQVR